MAITLYDKGGFYAVQEISMAIILLDKDGFYAVQEC